MGSRSLNWVRWGVLVALGSSVALASASPASGLIAAPDGSLVATVSAVTEPAKNNRITLNYAGKCLGVEYVPFVGGFYRVVWATCATPGTDRGQMWDVDVIPKGTLASGKISLFNAQAGAWLKHSDRGAPNAAVSLGSYDALADWKWSTNSVRQGADGEFALYYEVRCVPGSTLLPSTGEATWMVLRHQTSDLDFLPHRDKSSYLVKACPNTLNTRSLANNEKLRYTDLGRPAALSVSSLRSTSAINRPASGAVTVRSDFSQTGAGPQLLDVLWRMPDTSEPLSSLLHGDATVPTSGKIWVYLRLKDGPRRTQIVGPLPVQYCYADTSTTTFPLPTGEVARVTVTSSVNCAGLSVAFSRA